MSQCLLVSDLFNAKKIVKAFFVTHNELINLQKFDSRGLSNYEACRRFEELKKKIQKIEKFSTQNSYENFGARKFIRKIKDLIYRISTEFYDFFKFFYINYTTNIFFKKRISKINYVICYKICNF